MSLDLLIEIFVLTNPETKEGRLATGYPVARGLILTAGHVLKGEAEILVRWHYQQGEAGKWRSATIAWQGEGEMDAALLTCPFPDAVPGFGKVDGDEGFKTGDRWESRGFPRVGRKEDGSREPVSMTGLVFNPADTKVKVALGVEFTTPIPEEWQGASGSPVFIGGKIVGVIASCPENFRGKRFEAVRCKKLLENDEFNKLLGYDHLKEHQAKVRKVIEDVLAGSPKVMDFLAKLMKFDLVKDDRKNAEILADKLIQEGKEGLRMAKEAFYGLNQVEERLVLQSIVVHLLPLVWEQAGVLPGNKHTPIGQVLTPPLATFTGVEAAIANRGERGMNLKPPEERRNFPPGKQHLHFEWLGREGDVQAYMEQWFEHFNNEFSDSSFLRFGRDAVIEVINDGIKRKSIQGLTPYYALEVPPDDQSVYHQLAKLYPWVAIVAMTGDVQIFKKEAKELNELWDIIFFDEKEKPS